MNLFCVEENLCLSNLLMDLNDIGILIFAGPLNRTHYLIGDFQKKCQNYHQNHFMFCTIYVVCFYRKTLQKEVRAPMS